MLDAPAGADLTLPACQIVLHHGHKAREGFNSRDWRAPASCSAFVGRSGKKPLHAGQEGTSFVARY